MNSCPRCGSATHRVSFPFWLRPLRLFNPALRRVRCHICGWHGIRTAPPPRAKARASHESVDDAEPLSFHAS